ncbi:AMP-binding protein [Bradyrhizobium japonicum]
MLQRSQHICDLTPGRDYDWASLRRKAMNDGKKAPCVPVAATDPLYILYTSGTTGIPKGVVRDNGGHLVAVKWSMFNLYGVKPGEVWWCGSDIGWVVGHSYIIYGPLLHGATSIMYEGKPIGTPDAGAFWRVISEHKAVAFFTAPTAFRAIRKEDPEGKFIRQYDLSQFRTLFLAGERADPPTVEWAEQQLKVPVIDHWWQTETGWCIAGNPVGLGMLPVKHGSPTVPMPGYQVDVVDEAARQSAPTPSARSSSSCRCRRGAYRRCGIRTRASRTPTSLNSPATTKPRTPATRMRTAMSSSWAAPTTSSMSPATGSPPAAWRRFWPRIRTSPNVPCSASRTRSRARCPAASWCSRPA